MLDEPSAKRKSWRSPALSQRSGNAGEQWGKERSKNCRHFYLVTGKSAGSFQRRHHFNSWLSSVTSMPGITINLQLSISRDSSSSGNWQDTRQYWHSWFQQNRAYGIVSGLMNWKQRKRELRSGTWNFFPRMVISTSFSYGRNGSDMSESCFPRTSVGRKSGASLHQCTSVVA